jgi:hypothetical protein
VPVVDSTRRFSAAACHPGRHHRAALTIEVFPGASHRIQVDASADLALGYLGILVQWNQGQGRHLRHLSMHSRHEHTGD